MKLKSGLLSVFLLLAAQSCALAASTIDPTQPPTGSALVSAVVRNNFVAAFNDINNLLSQFASPNPPANPSTGQLWRNTSVTPNVINQWSGTAWLEVATFDALNGQITPFFGNTLLAWQQLVSGLGTNGQCLMFTGTSTVPTAQNCLSGGSFAATAPIASSTSGAIDTLSLNIDSNFAVAANNLALAPIAAGDLIANCGGSTAEPSNCTWNNFANQAISSTNGAFPARISGTWQAGSPGTGLAFAGTTLNLQPASVGAIGGVNSIAPVSHQWVSSISTAGLPSLSQPAVSDISGFGTGVATALGNALNASGGLATAASPSFSGTITGSFGFSGNINFSGQLIATGTTLPAQASGQTVVGGSASLATLTATAQAFYVNSPTFGALVQGDGSTSDFAFFNKNIAQVFSVPTGTTTLNFPSLPSGGTCVSGLILVSGGNLQTGACPGAAASVQPGTTTITSGTNHALLSTGAGTLGQVGPGILGQFDAAQGAGADPIFVAGPFTLIPGSTVTAPGGTTTISDGTHITSSYVDYELVCTNLVPSTSGVTPQLQWIVSGSLVTTNYSGQTWIPNSTAIVTTGWSTFIATANSVSVSNAAPGNSFRILIHNAAASSIHSLEGLGTYLNTGATMSADAMGGALLTSGPITGWQFSFSSGTINAGGFCKLYGRL